jgi:hypothetical protein
MGALGGAMVQAVIRWPLTAEAPVRTRFSPCGIVVDKVALGQVVLCQYNSTVALHTHRSRGG